MLRVSLSKKLWIVPIVLFSAIGVILSSVVWGIQAQSKNGLVIDLAGRQRMLNQRQFKEALLVREGVREDYLATRALFDTTLSRLLDGGAVKKGGETLELPAAHGEDLRNLFLESQAQSARFAVALDAFVSNQKNASEQADQLNSLQSLNQEIHATANRAVTLLVSQSQGAINDLLKTLLIISLVVLFAGVIVVIAVTRNVLIPIRRTGVVLDAVATGDLTQRLDTARSDELGTMAKSINQAIEGISTAFSADQVEWAALAQEQRDAERLQAMVQSAPSSLLMTDASLVIRYMNPAAHLTLAQIEHKLPVPVDQLIGQSVSALLNGVDEPVDSSLSRFKEDHEETIEFDDEIVSVQISPITSRKADYLGAMLTLEMITERLNSERAMAEAQQNERDQSAALQIAVERLLVDVSAAAEGDLTRMIHVDSDDAIGQMGTGLNRLFAALRSNLRDVTSNANTLSNQSGNLAVLSSQMSSTAQGSSDEAARVSSAAEIISGNVDSVASAAEQMSASISEIANQVDHSARVASQAVDLSRDASVTIRDLSESSASIDQILKVITAIAEQTNLLALNATIEAARAGEAGKGFAVVANEVKELAKDTARATEEIQNKILGIRTNSEAAVLAIDNIGDIIAQLNAAQETITAGIKEQSSVTNEIASTVATAASGNAEIVRGIGEVAVGADESLRSANSTQVSAQELSEMATRLTNLTAQFRCDAA